MRHLPDSETGYELAVKAGLILALAWFLAAAAHGGTIRVPSSANLQAAANGARSGDVVLLGDGTFSGGLNLGTSGVTVQAENIGKAIISGGQVRIGGTDNALKGVVVRDCRTNWDTAAVVVEGTGGTLEDVTAIDNESAGFDFHGCTNATATRIKSIHNGSMGITSGDVNGRRCNSITLIDPVASGNNYGMVNPVWKGIVGKTVFKDGLWYRLPGDAGGGMKICTADNVTIKNPKSFDNGGPGLWFDVYVTNIVVTSPECFNNHNVVSNQQWEAAGIAVEICDGPTLIENAYSHDNTGSDFACWESNNVTLRNCIAGTKGIEVRDLGGDRGAQGWLNKNVLFDGVKLYNGGKINYWGSLTPAVRQQRNIVERNVVNATGAIAWATTQPATLPATQPATQPVQSVTDGQGTVWTLTLGGKLTKNGVLLTETSGVLEIGVVDGFFYQSATSGNWKWAGTGWTRVSAIPAPATQPTTQPATLPSTQPVVTPPDPIVRVDVVHQSGKVETSKP